MRKKPLVSVIVPVYLVEKYISECIQSILNQTYKNIEVIAVCDGSPDCSASICKEFANMDSRIHLIEKENGGVSSARNEGIRAAHGNYLMFVDGDDWINSNTVENMLQNITDSDVEACFCNCYYRNESDIVKATELEGRFEANVVVRKHLHYGFIASPCLSLVSCEKCSTIFFDEEIHTLEDWEYNFRLLNSLDNLIVVSEPYYHYRAVMGSASKSMLNSRKMSCFLIPSKVNAYIEEKCLPYMDEARYVPVFLVNHILVILANTEYEPKEAKKLRVEAHNVLGYTLKSKGVLFRQKVYILLASISPKLFCIAYHLKWRKTLR